MTESSCVSSANYGVANHNEDEPWRIILAQMWEELTQFPSLQRTVVMLSFSDDELTWFWSSGIASIRQIGRTIQLAPEQFNRLWVMLEWNEDHRTRARTLTAYDEKFALLWQQLPLNDLTIAALLETTQQNIVQLRHAAQQRLLRKISEPLSVLSPDVN